MENDDRMATLSILFILGFFQMIMSLSFALRKNKSNFYLDLHLVISLLYIFMLIGLEPVVFKDNILILMGLIPLKIAVLFTLGVRKKIKYEEAIEMLEVKKNSLNYEQLKV